jgi:hypothetical protein
MMDKINLNDPAIFDEDAYVMIRGYPRAADKVKHATEMVGGVLVTDKEAGLLNMLDQHLFMARVKTGEYPEYLMLEREPGVYYLPIPYEVGFLGLELPAFHKPAWYRVTKKFSVQALPWRNKDVKQSNAIS